MKLAFFSNFLNHHQLPLCLEWQRALGDNFTFVAMQPLDKNAVASSYKDMNKEYSFCLCAYESENAAKQAQQLALESDVVLFGAVPVAFFAKRIKQNKTTFRYSERIFKPYYTKNMLYTKLCAVYENFRYSRKSNVYLLTAGGFSAHDYNVTGGFINRCYKWGYFPAVKAHLDVEKNQTKALQLLWAGRMVEYKKAESVKIALKILKDNKIDFTLTMVGDGYCLEKTKIALNEFESNVKFVGALSIEQTRSLMQQSDIFLFTSDESEGWGAVLNEAMAENCAVVASVFAGASTFLIENGENGFLVNLKTENGKNDFAQKVLLLAQNENLRNSMAQKAVETMQTMWSAQNAVSRFLSLAKAIENKQQIPQWQSGPCSKDEALSIKKAQKYLKKS